MPWTQAAKDRLPKLISEGLSASEIAKDLNTSDGSLQLSRNAVIGMAHRMGLSGGGQPAKNTVPRIPREKPFAPMPRLQPKAPIVLVEPVVIPAPVQEVAVPATGRVSLLDLRVGMCKWPEGEPSDPEFGFCGKICDAGSVYCTFHRTIAYQPAAERKRAA